jgi:hypothetical protein
VSSNLLKQVALFALALVAIYSAMYFVFADRNGVRTDEKAIELALEKFPIFADRGPFVVTRLGNIWIVESQREKALVTMGGSMRIEIDRRDGRILTTKFYQYSMAAIDTLLRQMLEKGGSDLHLIGGRSQ